MVNNERDHKVSATDHQNVDPYPKSDMGRGPRAHAGKPTGGRLAKYLPDAGQREKLAAGNLNVARANAITVPGSMPPRRRRPCRRGDMKQSITNPAVIPTTIITRICHRRSRPKTSFRHPMIWISSKLVVRRTPDKRGIHHHISNPATAKAMRQHHRWTWTNLLIPTRNYYTFFHRAASAEEPTSAARWRSAPRAPMRLTGVPARSTSSIRASLQLRPVLSWSRSDDQQLSRRPT